MTQADRGLPRLPQHPWRTFGLSNGLSGTGLAGPRPASAIDLTATAPLPTLTPPPPAAPPAGRPLLRDRWWFLIVFLVAFALLASTDAGRIFYDTKLGVDIDASQFLSRLWSLWNAREWLGSLEDQYIGYAIPMAPFYLAGQLLHVPVWLIERLWLALLLAVGFTGLVKLARALEIGSETSRLLAGTAFVLWPTFTILIGSTSATALPGLVVPWAVLPLVSAARGTTSTGRAAARSGLAIVAMSGVNAACTLAVLILPGIYILTHTRSGQRVRLSLAWAAAVFAATAWWAIPLLLQGRYAFNFLPYIEQAATTTKTLSAAAVLRGTGTWTAYFNLGGVPWLSAGWTVVTAAPVILASAAVSAIGLAGLARRDMPERRWLTICAGLTAMVALAGYYGPLGGPWHVAVDHLLDSTLAPFRSLYKLEPVLAVALTLGFAHAVDRVSGLSVPLRRGRLAVRAATAPVVALALIGLAWPQLGGQVLQAGSITAIPRYWYQAAGFLAAHSPRQTALVVPSDPHGQFTWGETIDDPLEPLASSPWVERGLVPYANAGSQVLLETMEQAVESGHEVPGLAAYLARAGIRYVVVRNDVAPDSTGYVPPQVVNQTLAQSGFQRVAAFGPAVTAALGRPNLAGISPGLATSYPAVEVFQAADRALRPAGPVTAVPAAETTLVNGGPDALLQLQGQGIVGGQPAVIAGQQLPVRPALWAVTDGQPRADNSFGSTQDFQSYPYTATGTNPAGSPLGAAGGQPRQLLPVSADGHQTVAVLHGAASVTASSVGSWITESPQYNPVNAFDGNPATAWVEGSPDTPAGQWVQISFRHPVNIPADATIQLLDDTRTRPVATSLLVTTAAGTAATATTRTGASQALRLPAGPTRTLRITILAARPAPPGGLGAGISDVSIPGVRVSDYLSPAQDFAGGTGAAAVAFSFTQHPVLAASQANASGLPAGQRLDRTFVLPAATTLTARLTAVPVAGPALDALVDRLAADGKKAFRVHATSDWDGLPYFGAASMYTPASTLPWIAATSDRHPGLTFSWRARRTIGKITLTAAAGLPLPAQVSVTSPVGVRTARVGRDGVVRISPPLRTRRLGLTFPARPGSAALTGLARVSVPGLHGLDPAVPQPDAAFHLGCGQGPEVYVNGQSYRTAVMGTVGDLMQLRPVRVRLCTRGSTVSMTAGRQWLHTGMSTFLTVTSASLTSGSAATAARPAARAVRITGWGSDSRTLRVGPGPASYVEVHEAYNPGWTASLGGRPLTPVTLDGWQQAFLVPAGQGGVITLTFRPATVYHAGLIFSALALLALLACALRFGALGAFRRRRRGRGPGTDGRPGTGPALTAGPGRVRGRPAPGRLPAWLSYRPLVVFRGGGWQRAELSPATREASLAIRAASHAVHPAAQRPASRGGVHAAHAGRADRLADAGGPTVTGWRAGTGRVVRALLVLLPLTAVIAVAGGAVAAAVPALAVLAWWRPRWRPVIAAAAMLAAGLVVALSADPTVPGRGPFSGTAQLLALVALAAALLPALPGRGERDRGNQASTPGGS